MSQSGCDGMYAWPAGFKGIEKGHDFLVSVYLKVLGSFGVGW